jgi:hypothetical protein
MSGKEADKGVKPEDIKIEDTVEAPPEGYTTEEWMDLSESEKAGILDEIKAPEGEEEPEAELTDAEKAELAAIAADENKPDENPDGDDDNAAGDKKPGEDGKTPEADAKPDENKPDETASHQDDDATDAELLSFKPLVAASEVKIEEIVPEDLQKKLDGLDEKFDDGELTQKEYNEQRDKVNREIYRANDIRIEEAKSDLAWKKEQIHFLNAKPEYMPSRAKDATEKIKCNALFGALTEMVKAISGDPVNENLTGMQILVKADKAVKEAFGLKKDVPVKKDDKGAGKPKEDKAPAARLPDIKTLADVPAAAGNSAVIDDSFAQLDKLTGDAYEDAIASLKDKNPKAAEAYLARV